MLDRILLLGVLLLASLGTVRGAAAERLTVCHGYSCQYRTQLDLGPGDIKHVAALMRAGASSAEAERRAVSRVVQYFERRAAAAIGVSDRPKSDFGKGRERGQMDCVDESTNTNAVLRLLARHGLLKHHKVMRRVSRGFFADGRYPHFTAVLKDSSGQQWAVDSWYEPAGGPPDIMPLERWKVRGVGGRR